MTKGSSGSVFWCFLWVLSNTYAASGQCSKAASRLLNTSTLPLFANLAREHGIGEELLEYAAPASFEFRRDGFPTGGEDGAVVFKMGDSGEREVKLTKPIEMQATMVTQLQYRLVMRENPSRFVDGVYKVRGGRRVRINPNRPVEMVSWWEAKKFIRRLNKLQDGHVYRLPTEAEWEYAARGGTDTRYWFGDSENRIDYYAWFDENSNRRTHSVAQYPANPLGFYDIIGNAWEWTGDWHRKRLPPGTVADPTGPILGLLPVIRGGSWSSGPEKLCSAYRGAVSDCGHDMVGLRLVRTPRQDKSF